jgi:pimeloyl-ACP methyl ester carboxylesterase
MAAIFLPGITVPAHIAYAPLLGELAGSTTTFTKELEVYRDERPPDGYRLDLEIEGLERFAVDQGVEQFHLYGHSLGGAIALAYAAEHGDRVLSLALNEPATDFSEQDRAAIADEGLDDVPGPERMQHFVRQLLRPGVEVPPPPSGPPGPEMAKRPAGVAAATAALDAFDVDLERLRRYRGPVLYSYGALSNARWEAMAERFPTLFPRCAVLRYEDRHHLDAPHQAEPTRMAATLRELWAAPAP